MIENDKKQQTTEVEPKTSTPVSSQDKKFEDTITIGGETVTILKLKAGEFYKLQKVFGEILRSTITNPDDIDKMGAEQLTKLFSDLPTQIAEFVAVCSGKSKDELLEQAYPEEIAEAFGKGLVLNNVVENLKNSVAPMEKLGAVSKE